MSNNFFNNILTVTSAPMSVGHFVRHVGFFRWLPNGKDYCKNNFLFLGMTLVMKVI